MRLIIHRCLQLSLIFTACGPADAVAPGSSGGSSGDTGDTTDTGDAEPTTGGVPAECEGAVGVFVVFSVDIGDWPIVGDEVVIDAACEVRLADEQLRCTDSEGAPRTVGLKWSGTPELPRPLVDGQAVMFHLRRPADEATRGAWTVRDAQGELLVAGNRADASHPGDPEFFAPLRFAVDASICPSSYGEDCFDAQPFLISVDDGVGTRRVGTGQTIATASGYRMQVERAGMYVPISDPKFCPVDDTPPAFEFLIVRAAP